MDCAKSASLLVVLLCAATVHAQKMIPLPPNAVLGKGTNEIKLVYQVAVPPEVPENLVYREKDGTQSILAHSREVYAAIHRNGWDECLENYFKRQLNVNDEKARPQAVQEVALTGTARQAGFTQCRLALKDLVTRHGDDRVRQTLMATTVLRNRFPPPPPRGNDEGSFRHTTGGYNPSSAAPPSKDQPR